MLINEPVIWSTATMMITEKDFAQAFEEYRSSTFIKD